jgi:Flp pilus assembly protein TadG
MAQAVSFRVERYRNERGAELIEFALILPLILILLMGIFDFGLAFQRYEVITNAAREGARLGSLQAAYSDDDIKVRVNAYCTSSGLPGGCPVGSATTVNRNVPIDVGGGVNQSGIQVVVRYNHSFSFLGPILSLIGGSMGSVNLTAASTMRNESGGAPPAGP